MTASITKRGLLAPQNTFLDSLLKTISAEQTHFVVANARLEHYPIVLVSDAFASMFGYSKSEIMFEASRLHGRQKTLIVQFTHTFCIILDLYE